MNILIIDQEALGLDFALRCTAAGHSVRWFREEKRPSRDGEGFKGIVVVDDWRQHMKWAKEGLILCTGNDKYIGALEGWRDLGFKIFAPTPRSAALEIKRSIGMDLLKKAGIEVSPYKTFNSLEEAERFARKSDQAYVFKTMGDETDKSLSYVSSDPADLVGWIQQKIKRGLRLKGPCILQEKIDMLCDYGASGWVGPDGFLPDKWQICFEHKKLMNGEIGPNTGEQGTVCQYVKQDKIADEMLKPLEKALIKLGHRGDFSIGVGIDKNGKAWPFEFTARLGWPAFFIQVASHIGDPAQWMRDLLDGKDTLQVSYKTAIGVVLAQPMYPYQKSPAEIVEGNPITGAEDVLEDLHFCSVMKGRGPKMKDGKVVDSEIYQTTGEYVMVATGLGKNIEKSRETVYDTIDQVKFPNMMYRTDIGEKVQKYLPDLHEAGYALEMLP